MTLLDHRGQPFQTLESLNGSSRLAVFYPGVRYSPMAPLFFYLSTVLESAGWDVLAVDYRYGENAEFQAASDTEKDVWFHEDSLVVGRQMAAVSAQYQRAAYVGKSLGTRMLFTQMKAGLLGNAADLVWATPDRSVAEIYSFLPGLLNRSLLVYGTADGNYEKGGADRAKGLPQVSVLEMPGVGHALETAGDIRQSALNVVAAVEAIAAFLDGRT